MTYQAANAFLVDLIDAAVQRGYMVLAIRNDGPYSIRLMPERGLQYGLTITIESDHGMGLQEAILQLPDGHPVHGAVANLAARLDR